VVDGEEKMVLGCYGVRFKFPVALLTTAVPVVETREDNEIGAQM
jgi:hypothetical protein